MIVLTDFVNILKTTISLKCTEIQNGEPNQ